MATTINYAATARLAAVTISTANTNRDGTGTVATLITGVAAGTRIEAVRFAATGNTTAGVVRLFLHDGTNFFLIREELVQAITASTTVPVFMREVVFGDQRPLTLPSASWSLRVSTHIGEAFTAVAVGADH